MNLAEMNRNDLAMLAGGALTFLLSLFPAYVTVSVDSGGLGGVGLSEGTNAWTSFATLGVLLILAATAVVAIRTFAPQVLPTSIPWNLIIAGVTAVATVLLILRPLTVSGVMGISVGPGWSAWLIFASSIAMTVFAVRAFLSSGEKIPGADSGAGESSPS